jgi:hypothetical protein
MTFHGTAPRSITRVARGASATNTRDQLAWTLSHGRSRYSVGALFRWACTIFDKDGGDRMELFDRSAFSEIESDIPLRMNHNNLSRIPCDLRVHVAPDGLDFIARVPDSPQARYLLMLSNEIRGVSIECLHQQTAPDPGLPPGRGIVVKRAKLLGISISAGPNSRRPAWFGTSCRVVRVSE